MDKRTPLNLLSLLCFMCVMGSTTCLYAQNNPYENNYDFDENDPRHFEQVEDRYHKYFELGKYNVILKSLLNEFISQDSLWAENNVQDEKEKFQTALSDLIAAYKKVKNWEIRTTEIDGEFSDIDQYDDFTNTPLSYFSSDPELKITIIPDSLDTLQAIDIRYRIHTIQRIADRITNEDRVVAELRINQLNKQWDNFHFKGKSQYPWEFLVNSWRLKNKGPIIEPPKSQIIFLHPNISLELDVHDTDAFKSYQVFNIEVFGFAWGINNYSHSIAFSSVFSLSNEFGNGIGGMLSWNNVQLGAVYHNNLKRTNLLVTMDFLKLLQSGEKQWESLRN